MISYEHSHTHIRTSNPPAVIDFYTKVLGAKLIAERALGGGRVATDLDLGGVPIRISGSTGADKILEPSGPHIGLHHLGLAVENLGEAVADLKSHGVEFILEPGETVPGTNAAFVMVPENVLIEVAQKKK
jgi:catechol 2,3-dioxygenase-like lactoylglutathione lyase family enzyme